MLTPTRYKFQNEEVLVDPRDGGNRVVGTIPNSPTRYTPPQAPQPEKVVYQPTPVQTPSTGQNFAPQSLLTPEQFALQRGGGVDEAAIREETRKNMQAQIDATNAYYADLIAREQQAGEERNAKVQAINVNSGLSGSPFATTADLKQKSLNQQAVKGIEAERNMQIQGLLEKVDEIARGEIQAKKAEALGNAEAYTKYLADAKAESENQLKQMAGANIDLSTIPEAQRRYLLNRAFGDEAMGEVIYNSLKPKATQIDYKFEKLADGEGLFYGVDPTTGQLKQQRVSVDVPAGFDLTIAPDGTPILFNKKTGEAKIAGGFGEGQFAKPGEGVNDLLPTEKDRAAFNQIVNKYNASPLIAASDRTIILGNTVKAVQADPGNAALQLNLAYGYIQALDTYQSAVREGELANVNTIDSKIGKVQNYFEQITSGQTVRPEIAIQLAEAAKLLVDYISEGAKRKEKAFESQARVNGIDAAWNSFRSGFETNYDSQSQTDPREQELRQKFPDATDEEIREVLGFNGSATGSSTNKVGAGMRTDRHNNPTAFTTDIAKAAGLKVGVDYLEGDPFSGGKYKTAKLLGDPVETTIKVIDTIGFFTQSGKPRWTYIDKIPQAKNWNRLSYQEKANVIKQMYRHEGGTQLLNNFA